MANFFNFIIIFIFVSIFQSSGINAALPGLSRDLAALSSFSAAITGDPHGVLHSWRSPEIHVCNWTGVTCHLMKDRVVQLDLSGRDLIGVISPEVANLSFLAVLDLSGNFFSGRIPLEIGSLSRLKQLSLSSNILVGTIPAQLGFLHRLVYLDLSGNQLDDRIPEPLFCSLSSLQYMDLSNNSLSGEIPLGNQCSLLELRFLLLWSNNLLEWIDLESNFLSGELPSEIFDKTPYLQFLHLSYNNFTSHGGNTKLEPFFDSLPQGEIPVSIGSHVNLFQLHLEENFLSGPIPPNISNLVNLTYLNLSNNKLERLYLSNNLLSGEIPVSLGELPHLGLLDFSSNLLSGSIPESFSNLTQLRLLMLNNNRLSGMIPRSLGNCMNLENLDLSYNQLTGRIPSDVAALSSLKLYFNLSNNFLEGSIPLELSKMDMLLALDLSSNNFSDKIPPQLGSCIALEYLNLSGNALHGPLPRSIGGLPYLEALDLSSNQLEGAMPESLKDSSTLKLLNISYNNFSGIVPEEGVFAVLSMDSFLGNPGLCGSISGMSQCGGTGNRAHRSMILPILMALISTPCIICFCVCFLARKLRRKLQLPIFKRTISVEDAEEGRQPDYPRISYWQLMEATGAFSESNVIGSGRFGQVYKGILHDESTKIAVKVLNPKSGVDISKSFKRECEVLKTTRHRNLIRIITTCSKSDFKALVLPLMVNGSLESHLYPRGLSLVQVVSIASDIAEGIAYMHHYSPVKIVHCDLKPSNVLLDEDMTALVADFGIARLMNCSADETNESLGSSPCISTTGLLCGSVGYIAPEYGMGGQPSMQGDVYSFGVVLLEMITGKRPTDVIFQEGHSLHEWVNNNYPHNIEKIMMEAPLRDASQLSNSLYYKKLRRDVTMELIELGLVCTQFSPSMRPMMNDVAHELALMKKDLYQHAMPNLNTNLESCSE
ncbi:Non-specific serine/threonine protein kinase protein [Dioscorea alata]|uniref:Non-specific serine/threonine protein kinase protein n=1 Tax=Dioscorea alata TaxID=55571 RepID=A0ACB7VLG0_DIOAL|nr:Non-specific serine/threonine protein kinase protein [Dioscorea alata]